MRYGEPDGPVAFKIMTVRNNVTVVVRSKMRWCKIYLSDQTPSRLGTRCWLVSRHTAKAIRMRGVPDSEVAMASKHLHIWLTTIGRKSSVMHLRRGCLAGARIEKANSVSEIMLSGSI